MLIPVAPVGMLSSAIGRWEGSSAATGETAAKSWLELVLGYHRNRDRVSDVQSALGSRVFLPVLPEEGKQCSLSLNPMSC